MQDSGSCHKAVKLCVEQRAKSREQSSDQCFENMVFRHFREIIAWQRAKELSLMIYRLFGKSRDFGFRDQIQRSSVSVMANIAEGYGRNSDKEFIRFLEISKGSLNETQSFIDLAKDLKYIDEQQYLQLDATCDEITKLIYGLIKKLLIEPKAK